MPEPGVLRLVLGIHSKSTSLPLVPVSTGLGLAPPFLPAKLRFQIYRCRIGEHLTGEKVEDKKKTQDGQSKDADIHEESLGVKTLIKLDNLDGLIEDRVNEEVASSISVVKVDGQSNGSASEGISGDEGVGHGGLLLGLDTLGVVDGGEVLEVEGEVHGISEGGLHAIDNHLLVSLVCESNQELSNLTSRQFYNSNNMNNTEYPSPPQSYPCWMFQVAL